MNRIGFYICCLLLLFATNTIAQVTIGSGFPPAKGALLDLKQNDYVSENSTKGVLFPRVMLSNEHELYPMFGTEGKEIKEYTDNRNKLKIEHKGLIVYNLSEENDFFEGLYSWDGTKWRSFVKRVVLPPSIDELLCEQAKLFPARIEAGAAYSGILTIPYIGGNGMDYLNRTYEVNGLTIERLEGSLNIGQGLLYYRVSGTPDANSIELTVNFEGKECTIYFESESDMEVKTIEYVRKRINVKPNSETNREESITTLGNLQVRYYGSDGTGAGEDFMEFRTLENTHLTYQYTKHGKGGNFIGIYGQIASSDRNWYYFTYDGNRVQTDKASGDINLHNRDIATATFILHNTREVYRLTLNANKYLPQEGNIPEVPARVSIFIEKLE